MIEVLSGFPDDVLAMAWRGEVTADDYKDVAKPAVKEKLKKNKNDLRMFAKFGPDFHGMSPGAALQDTKLGISNWDDFGRIAVVTDVGWMRTAIQFFAPFFHGPIRVFSTEDSERARVWLAQKEKKNGG